MPWVNTLPSTPRRPARRRPRQPAIARRPMQGKRIRANRRSSRAFSWNCPMSVWLETIWRSSSKWSTASTTANCSTAVYSARCSTGCRRQIDRRCVLSSLRSSFSLRIEICLERSLYSLFICCFKHHFQSLPNNSVFRNRPSMETTVTRPSLRSILIRELCHYLFFSLLFLLHYSLKFE